MSNPVTAAAHAEKRPRVVFFGMRCAFSVPPLQALIDAGMTPVAVVLPNGAAARAWVPIRPVPASIRRLPVAPGEPGIDAVAHEAGIRAFDVRNLRSPAVLELLRGFEADLFAFACFPWRVPAVARALAPLGCLNVHPSLLPRWRGPEPLVWTFLAGDRLAGATVHVMDDGFDTGPIVRQTDTLRLHGVDGAALERELAGLGGKLLVEAVAAVAAGEAPAPQDEARATRAPVPTDDDLTLSTEMSQRQLVDVVNGVAPLLGPLTLRVPAVEQAFSVVEAVEVGPQEPEDLPLFVTEDVVLARCADGVVAFRRAARGNVRPLTLRGAM